MTAHGLQLVGPDSPHAGSDNDELSELLDLVDDLSRQVEQLDARMGAHEAALTTLTFAVGRVGEVASALLAEVQAVRQAGAWRTIRGRRR